jgi:hypothetical protein
LYKLDDVARRVSRRDNAPAPRLVLRWRVEAHSLRPKPLVLPVDVFDLEVQLNRVWMFDGLTGVERYARTTCSIGELDESRGLLGDGQTEVRRIPAGHLLRISDEERDQREVHSLRLLTRVVQVYGDGEGGVAPTRQTAGVAGLELLEHEAAGTPLLFSVIVEDACGGVVRRVTKADRDGRRRPEVPHPVGAVTTARQEIQDAPVARVPNLDLVRAARDAASRRDVAEVVAGHAG